jgi:anti-sigma factor RsiW/sugar lactone lactonase YvrE
VEETPHCAPETLSALLDGELTLLERAAARTHLATCGSCTAAFAAFGRVDAEFSQFAALACTALLPSLSAMADGESSAVERATVERHLVICSDCRSAAASFRRVEALLAGVPAAAPSAKVDQAIAAIVARQPARRLVPVPPVLAWRAVVAAALVIAIALGSSFLPANAPVAPEQAGIAPSVAFVASQHVVFDDRTNTLYLLNTQRADVTAVDSTSQTERARIDVGGTPSALALSSLTNRLLVLDASTKRLTEIDTTSNSVVGYSTLAVTGTLTSIQVDAAGRIVVASVTTRQAATPASAAASDTATGHVTVLDATTKQVETVKAVDVAPQLVILRGGQALLLSTDATTLVDATSYKSIARLPAGVAAAFDIAGRTVAVLSADGDSSKVTFRGEGLPASLSLPGRPLALIAMPNGGFAALVDRGTGGEVQTIDGTGRVVATSPVTAAGHNLVYDVTTSRFAVSGDSNGALAFTPAATTAVAVATPSGSPAPLSSKPSPSPDVAAPVATTPTVPAISGLPPSAQFSVVGTYRLPLSDNRRPTLVAGAGGTLWFVDQAKRLASVNTVTGVVTDLAQLPLDGTFTRLLLGTSYAYVIDQGKGRISVYSLATGRFDTIAFPFAATAAGFSVGLDDRLWMAGGDSSNALSLEPAAKGVTAVDFRASSITALFADSAGRIWFADGVSGAIGYYDQSRKALVTIPVAQHSPVTALAMDRDGTLWAGTTTGQVLAVHIGAAGVVGSAGGPVAGLVRDASGAVWSYSTAPGTLAYRGLTTGDSARVAATTASSLAFDGRGRAWLGDPTSMAFYIVLNGDQ